jgi:hypothetical protein
MRFYSNVRYTKIVYFTKNYYTVSKSKKTRKFDLCWITNKILIHLYYQNILSHFLTFLTMKKTISCFFLFFSFFQTIAVLQAQHCGYIHQKNEEIERYTAAYVRDFDLKARPRAVVKIPVVVHVIWNTAAENISDTQIRGQIDSLTKDFRKKNTDAANIPTQRFRDAAVDCEIEFCLASRDTLGNPSTGIVRKRTETPNFGDGSGRTKIYYSSLGGDDAWRPSRYLNIWICAFSEGEINGYSTPIAKVLTTSPAEDGCVINYKAFGVSPNNFPTRNKGRTLVHEVGHYFNLLHVFGKDNTCNDDDEVEDTPKQAGPNSGCPSFPAPVSCVGNGGDMFMNYMDYPYDECVLMFSKGQKARMWAVLDTFRSGLILRGPSCDPFVATNDIAEKQWSVSPNPATASIKISFPEEWENVPKKIQLTDLTGRILLEKRVYTEGSLFSVENLSNGLYFVRLVIDNQVFTKKIVIAK